METFTIRSLRDIEAIEAIPLEERFSETSTYEALVKGSSKNPDHVAMSFLLNGDLYETPLDVTYGTLMERVRQAANCFHDLGVGPTDVVSYLLPNVPQTHYVLWGAEAAGIANPINPLLEPGAIRDICRAARTKVLVTLGDLPGTEVWKKVMEIRHEIPTLEVILALLGKTDRDNRIFGLDEKLAEYPGDRLTFSRQIAPDDIASLYHTGGTTGRPKLAQRSHYNELSNAYQMGLLSGFTPDNKVMCGLPLFHVNGTIVTGLAPFWQGAQVVLLSPQGYRDPGIIKNFYRIIEKFKGTFFSSVPTILSVLLDVPKGDADISSLRYAICGAAPLSVELFKNFEAYTGLKVLEGYGLTESAAGASVNPKDGERRVGSIGLRFPYEEMKVAVLDDDGHYVRDANAGEIGVIVLRGPNIFKGYVDEAHNRGVWIDGGWFNTGDLGRTDPDGYFWLTGRRKELIIRGGHNLDPSSIEGPLYKMGKIRTAAAVGKPDAHAGEVPVVYVELKDTETATPEEIIAFLRQHITERAALPKEVYILDKLPLTPIGKVFKPALAWDATRRAYEEALQGLGDLATSVQVTVGEDAVSGKLAKIAVTAAPGADRQVIRDLIRGKLARYTVKFEITVT